MLSKIKISRKSYPYLLTVPAMAATIILILYPLGYLLFVSFSTWKPGTTLEFATLTNYISMLGDEDFWHSLRITATYLIGVVSVEFALGFAMALLVNNLNKRLISLVRLCILLPWMIPPIIAAFTFRIMFDPLWGVINYGLSFVGVKNIAWTVDPSTALIAIMIADIWRWTPFMFLLLTAGIQSLPITVLEAATIDGASSFQMVGYITIPMIKNVMIISLMFRSIDALQAFDIIYMITQGGPGTATTTLNIYTFITAIYRGNLGYGSALAVIMLIVILLAMLAMGKASKIVEI